MFAVRYEEYGDPSVLEAGEVPEPHAGEGQIRIAVQAAAVNPLDWKLRSGAFAERMPATFPVVPGSEAAGLVDEVGDGVTGVAIGDEVFGLGSGTAAEYAVLDHFAKKPATLTWQQAAAVAVAAETAARVLGLLGLSRGQTLLVDNASGSVGSAVAQFAAADGITVIGTAGEGNHARLRELGVVPLTYGSGLAERVADIGYGTVDGAIDAAGKGSLGELVEITGSADRVVTIADPHAADHGVTYSMRPEAFDGLRRAADLAAAGTYDVAIDRGYHFNDAAEAHRRSEEGHLTGKIVFGG